MLEAKIICDSISKEDIRLITFQLRYPKFIHSELMTHRKFSRNASSSRAIPTKKLIEEVTTDALRASPVFWGKNQPGMQAAEELSEERTLGEVVHYSPKWAAQNQWEIAAWNAAKSAERMLELGVHKQIVNRILEPFSHINVVVSATEYMNFFGLRLDPGAQPEINALAELMWIAWNESEPKPLFPGEWHLPYITKEELDLASSATDTLLKVSVARCARVSYLSFETGKKSTIDEDLKLYDRLMGAQPLHASPAEHPATPDHWFDGHDYKDNQGNVCWVPPHWEHPSQHGNFTGWRQARKMIKGEDMAPLPEKYKRG